MRFKARVLADRINLFIKVVNTVQKINKECIVHLTERKIEFILSSEISSGGVQVWSGINALSIFDSDYKIDSLNNNEIAFEINLEHLQRALKSGQYAHDITIKLTKKNGNPFLSLVIQIQTTQAITIIQDVPIVLITPQQLAQYTEPHLSDPEVHIMMPPLKLLRHVIDKMKNIADVLCIEANMNGEMIFKVETETVTIQTKYSNLEHPQIEGRSPPRVNPDQRAAVKLDIKKFARFLFSYQVQPTNVICCMIEGRAIVLHVLLDDLYLTYYIPVLSVD